MNADEILFDPIVKPTQTPELTTGVLRRASDIFVEINTQFSQALYTSAAHEVMNRVVAIHKSAVMADARNVVGQPSGALDLTHLVDRYHDDIEEIWVARPKHMPPDLMRFYGRFGVKKTCIMPQGHGSFDYLYWAWIDSNAGELPALDLGIILVPVDNQRLYRVFANKSEANAYYSA